MHIHVYGLLSFGSWDSHLQRSARCQVRLVILGLFITGLDWLYGLYSLYFMGSFFRLIAYFFPVGHCFFFSRLKMARTSRKMGDFYQFGSVVSHEDRE